MKQSSRLPHRSVGRRPLGQRVGLPLVAPHAVVVLAGITAALHVGKLPPALPVLQTELMLSLLQAGFLLSLVQFAGMFLGLLVGLFAGSFGLRRSILIGLSILAVASAIGGFVQTAAPMLWLRGLEGIGFLLVVMPAPALIRQLVPPQSLSRALGLWGCYMGLGIGLALLIGPWVLSAAGWQAWWLGLAGWSGIMLVWCARNLPTRDERTDAAPSSSPDGWWERVRLTLSTPGPWLVAVIFALYSSQWLAVIGFLPVIYSQAGIPDTAAGALTAAAAIINIVGNLASGWFLHRDLAASRLIAFAFACMSVGSFLAFGPLTGDAPAVRYAGVLLFSAVGGMIPAALFATAVQLAPSEGTIPTTVGWMQQGAALGLFAGPPLAAWVASLVGGWHWTWVLTGLLALAGSLFARLASVRRD